MSQWLIEPRDELTLDRFEPVARWSQLQLVERDNVTGRWSVTGLYDDLAQLRLAGRGVVISADGVPVMSGRATSFDMSSGSSTVSGTSDFAVFDGRNVYPNPGSNWGAQSANGYDIQTGLAETVLLHYITANAGATAYAGNGTYSDRRVPLLVAPATLGRGPTIRHTGRFGQLSGVVAYIGEKANLQVDVIHDESTGIPRRLVVVREGEDRRSEIRFGTPDVLANGLIRDDWRYTVTAPATTDALVAGGGFLNTRTSGYAHDTSAIATWGHVIEQVVDQRSTTNQGELDDAAAAALADNNNPVQVDFTVVSLDPELTFGMHDQVSMNLRGVDLSNRVRERTTTIAVGNDGPTEQIEVVVGSRDSSAWVTVTQQELLDAQRRIAQLEAQ